MCAISLVFPHQCYDTETFIYKELTSGQIWDMAMKGSPDEDPVTASFIDFNRKNSKFTCVHPRGTKTEECNRELEEEFGVKYLDLLPPDWHHFIFNTFKADGLTPDTKGDQRGMYVSEEMKLDKLKGKGNLLLRRLVNINLR
jgi:hypothetical protein